MSVKSVKIPFLKDFPLGGLVVFTFIDGEDQARWRLVWTEKNI